MIVMMMASTPSLDGSSRLLPMGVGESVRPSQVRRQRALPPERAAGHTRRPAPSGHQDCLVRNQTIQWEAPMGTSFRAAGIGVAALVLSACAQAGGLGSSLGRGLGTHNRNQVTGTVQRVDTRYQQINITQSNGQAVSINYDNQTRVVYRNQDYSVGSLEYGGQVTARVQQTQNGPYYTDLVQVYAPARGSAVSANPQ